MKKILTVFAAIALVVAFGSCSKKSKIIGDWDIVKVCMNGDCTTDVSGTFSFESDGSYALTSSAGSADEGKWSLNDDVITAKSDDGTKDKLKIVKLDGKKLTLKAKRDGVSMVLYLEKE